MIVVAVVVVDGGIVVKARASSFFVGVFSFSYLAGTVLYYRSVTGVRCGAILFLCCRRLPLSRAGFPPRAPLFVRPLVVGCGGCLR